MLKGDKDYVSVALSAFNASRAPSLRSTGKRASQNDSLDLDLNPEDLENKENGELNIGLED